MYSMNYADLLFEAKPDFLFLSGQILCVEVRPLIQCKCEEDMMRPAASCDSCSGVGVWWYKAGRITVTQTVQ